MIGIASKVHDLLSQDDLALAAAQRGYLNLSAYARTIAPAVSQELRKEVRESSVVAALSRIVAELDSSDAAPARMAIQRLVVHSNLEGMTFERSERVSRKIRDIYSEVAFSNKTYLTVTQGINEITVIAESSVAQVFRKKLKSAHGIYDKQGLVGITVKFEEKYLSIPNLIYMVTRRLAYKAINIIEIVSTATELTYVIEKDDLAVALEQLQKDI